MNSEIDDRITKKYDVKKRLGKGAYGIVWKAIDRYTSQVVALKKIFDAFRNKTDAQRTFREIAFLQEFSDHPNIIKLQNVVKAHNDRDIYLVFEFMETDLHNVIKKANILKDIHKCYLMYQLFSATKFIHSGNVIHRDFKPSNILIDSNCFMKVCDFGLARSLTQLTEPDETDPTLTEYVATRWYRAPEILLASSTYTTGIDMWSLGCIFGEMMLGKPLFPGTSSLNQIEKILSTIRAPSDCELESMHLNYAESILKNIKPKPHKSLNDIMATHSKISIDLLIKLLQFNPNKRISANEALNHPFVSRFRNSSDDKIIGRNVILPFNDNIQLSIDQYRQKLYEMIKLKKLQRRTKRTEQAIVNSKSIYKKLISVGSNSYYKSNSLSSQKSCVNNMNDDCITSNGLKAIKSETFNDAQSVLHDSIRKKQKNSVEKPVEKIISPPKFYPRRNHLSPNITSLVNQKSKILRDTYNDKKKTSGRIISRWAFEPTCSWLPMINRNRNISNQSNHPTQNLKIDENCQYWQVKGQENTKSIRYSTYGKKQFDANNKDNLSRIGQRSILGGYSQLYSTLTASGLSAIQSRKI